MSGEIRVLRQRLEAYERLERALCPSGMGFAEHINNLQAQLARAQTPLWEDALTKGHNDEQRAEQVRDESSGENL